MRSFYDFQVQFNLGEIMKLAILALTCFVSLNAFAIPNPASKNCVEKGGMSQLVDGKNGQYSLCAFGKGKIEEWTLLRHNNGTSQEAVAKLINARVMAKDAATKCKKLAGTVLVDKVSSGADIQVCKFKDGSKIEANTLFAGAGVKSNKKLVKALK